MSDIDLGQALKRAIERNNELEAEIAEQARVNGMGGEREARLVAVNAELAEALTSIAKNTCCGDCQEARRVAEAALAKTQGEMK